MTTSVLLNGSVTLDETAGLQVGGVPVGGEDNNDNDIEPAALPAVFSARLDTVTGSAAYVGAAESPSNLITVTSDGDVTNLEFTKEDGTALPVYGVDPIGVPSGMTALDGGAISLFADPVLGSQMVLGVDATGDIVFALYLDPSADLTSAKIWMAQFEALDNLVDTDHDDALVLDGLGVAAAASLEFDFNALPSGQNLFGTVGTTSEGLVVIGKAPVLNADGTYTNASDTINTSKGGGPTTIGVDNQMFDPGDGAYFTFVQQPTENFLAGGVNGLTQNEADDADNIQYTGGTLEVMGAFTVISQTQGNSLATMRITTSDLAGTPQGSSFVSALGSGADADITAIRVYDASGTKIEDTGDLANFNSAAVEVTIVDNVATVSGLGAGYRVEWDTDVVHDQVLIECVAGKFDIGGFGATEAVSTVTPLTNVRFEDDGPSVTASATGAPELTVDETDLTGDDTDGFAGQFTADFGEDGAAAVSTTYALSTPGGDSGLTDTATGEAVLLSVSGGVIEGRTETSDELVFTVSVDASGNVTLNQLRAVEHDDTMDPDDSRTLDAANLVVLTATVTDGDGDTDSAPLDIGQLLNFEDDGPSVTASATGAPELTVDETDLTGDDTDGFAGQFTSDFGEDGEGAVGTTYALSTPGGDSGLTDTATGEAVLLSVSGGVIEGRTETSDELVFTVSVDGSGNVTLNQLRAVEHDDTTDPDDSRTLDAANLVVLTATVTDGDGDTDSAPLDIGQLLNFEDDGPSISGSLTGAPVLFDDESDLANNDTESFGVQFTADFGEDGDGGSGTTYALSTPGGSCGLVDTASGEAVVLSLSGGVVQGRTATSNLLVFTVGVDGSGNVTLDQQRSVMHADTSDPDDARTLDAANLVVLTASVTDGDGDSDSTSLDIGQLLYFEDDGPAIGAIPDSILDFAAGQSVTKSLSGDVGADPNAAPYTLVDYTASIVVNGVTVQGVLAGDAQSVTYWADTNGDGTFGNTGDTAYYELTLNQAGAGTYTFEVLVDPPPALLEFDFNALPSGQNLFGTVGTTADGLVVIGKTPILNADGTFTNASDTINTSKGGGPTTIGVDNQMFDPTDGAYFTFVQQPVENFLAGGVNGLTQNEADDADNIQYSGGTLELTTAYTEISQIQGNSLATMRVTTTDLGGSPQGTNFVSALGSGDDADITAIRVYDASDNKIEDTGDLVNYNAAAVSVTMVGNVATVSGLGAGYRVEWDTSAPHDQVLIECVAGKFDIGGFGASQAQATPDQVLNFVAQVTDGDGDTATDAFSVGIDGTGINDDGIVAGVVIV